MEREQAAVGLEQTEWNDNNPDAREI